MKAHATRTAPVAKTTPADPRGPRCPHPTQCPAASAPDRDAAHIVAACPEQGWSLRCNDVLFFDDTGVLLPDGQVLTPHRPLTTASGAGS